MEQCSGRDRELDCVPTPPLFPTPDVSFVIKLITIFASRFSGNSHYEFAESIVVTGIITLSVANSAVSPKIHPQTSDWQYRYHEMSRRE